MGKLLVFWLVGNVILILVFTQKANTCTICSIKGLSFGSKDYTKELKTVECTSFLGQTS